MAGFASFSRPSSSSHHFSQPSGWTSTKEATALHASNHVLTDAQQPKIHCNCIDEGFQLITRLLSLPSLQQG
jgi:hypothetical protein